MFVDVRGVEKRLSEALGSQLVPGAKEGPRPVVKGFRRSVPHISLPGEVIDCNMKVFSIQIGNTWEANKGETNEN